MKEIIAELKEEIKSLKERVAKLEEAQSYSNGFDRQISETYSNIFSRKDVFEDCYSEEENESSIKVRNLKEPRKEKFGRIKIYVKL